MFALSWPAWLKLNKPQTSPPTCRQHEEQPLALRPSVPAQKQTPLCLVLLLSLCWYVHWVRISQPGNSSCCQEPWHVCHSWQQGGARWSTCSGLCLSCFVFPFIRCCQPAFLPAFCSAVQQKSKREEKQIRERRLWARWRTLKVRLVLSVFRAQWWSVWSGSRQRWTFTCAWLTTAIEMWRCACCVWDPGSWAGLWGSFPSSPPSLGPPPPQALVPGQDRAQGLLPSSLATAHQLSGQVKTWAYCLCRTYGGEQSISGFLMEQLDSYFSGSQYVFLLPKTYLLLYYDT